MKKSWSIFGTAIASVIGLGVGARVFLGNGHRAVEPVQPVRTLPDACVLMSMSQEDRESHQGRLDMLGKAGRVIEKRADGFTFEINLDIMPQEEVMRWVENEQKCCGFLKLNADSPADGNYLRIDVEPPPETRDGMIAAFGLE